MCLYLKADSRLYSISNCFLGLVEDEAASLWFWKRDNGCVLCRGAWKGPISWTILNSELYITGCCQGDVDVVVSVKNIKTTGDSSLTLVHWDTHKWLRSGTADNVEEGVASLRCINWWRSGRGWSCRRSYGGYDLIDWSRCTVSFVQNYSVTRNDLNSPKEWFCDKCLYMHIWGINKRQLSAAN